MTTTTTQVVGARDGVNAGLFTRLCLTKPNFRILGGWLAIGETTLNDDLMPHLIQLGNNDYNFAVSHHFLFTQCKQILHWQFELIGLILLLTWSPFDVTLYQRQTSYLYVKLIHNGLVSCERMELPRAKCIPRILSFISPPLNVPSSTSWNHECIPVRFHKVRISLLLALRVTSYKHALWWILGWNSGHDGLLLCVCVCVCACVRACVRACARARALLQQATGLGGQGWPSAWLEQ